MGVVEDCKANMEKRLKSFDNDLLKVRTGRASIAMLDGVRVDYYGAPTPLNQIATLSTPDARTINVTPFEKKLIQDIEKAIMIADLGVTPNNDGHIVRVPIPQLTEERRKDIVKNLKKVAEEAKVGVRQVRRESNDELKKQIKDKKIAEDEGKRLEELVQKQTDAYIKSIDDRVVKKEQEVMKI
jgi:ribosome recycling factor